MVGDVGVVARDPSLEHDDMITPATSPQYQTGAFMIVCASIVLLAANARARSC
jgi:hypothetical protein